MSARSLFILAALLTLASAASFEAYIASQRESELETLKRQAADARRQLTRLREAIQTQRTELTDSEHPPVDKASAANGSEAASRAAETKAWLARTRRLQNLFETRPDQRIPEMQFLTDEDWLRAGKQASFADEHSTRLALGRVRTVAKGKFMPLFQAVLRSHQTANGGGEPPASLVALATLFDPPVDPAILERYTISRGSSPIKGRTLLNIDERAPIDASYDTRGYVSMDSNGGFSISSHGPPYAWIPDFNSRMVQAYQAYTAANKGVPPPQELAHIVPYFNPPLDAATIELVARFERDRRP